MSISQQILALETSRQNIAAAITQKGGTVSENDGFSQFATAITNLPSGGSGNPVLTSIDVSDFSGTTFNDCRSYITDVTIPSGVTSIGQQAFYYTPKLESVVLPNSVTTIGNGAFYYSGIRSIVLPSNLTVLNGEVLSGCSRLTTVELPSSLTVLSYQVFKVSTGLTTITIPSGVTSIGNQCFYGCTGLTSVICLATTPPSLGSSVFDNTNNCPIYVPAASVAAYKAASGWSTYESRIYGLETVATVDGVDVTNADLLNTNKSIITDTQVAALPSGDSISFAEGVTYIQGQITGYEDVELPSTTTNLDYNGFLGSSVTTLTCKATTPPGIDHDNLGGANLTAIYVPAANVADYQADAAWGQFSAITYPLYEVATVDGKSVYNADLGETGQVTTMTSQMLAALPTGTSVKFSDDIDTFSGQIGAYEQVTLPASGFGLETPLEFTVASPINAATETLVVPFNTVQGPDIVVANDTLGGAGLTEIIIESELCGVDYSSPLETLKETAGFTSFADIIKAKPEDFMVITNLDVEPNPDGVFTMSLAHGEQDTGSSDPNAMIYYAPFTICKPSFATDQATSDGTYLNNQGRQRTYNPTVTGAKLYNGDTLVSSEVYVEADNVGIGQDWDSANDVWSIILYTDTTGDGTETITLQPGMRIEGFIDGIVYDYDSETRCEPHAHSYLTINVTA